MQCARFSKSYLELEDLEKIEDFGHKVFEAGLRASEYKAWLVTAVVFRSSYVPYLTVDNSSSICLVIKCLGVS